MQTLMGDRGDHGFPQIPGQKFPTCTPRWIFVAADFLVPGGSILNRFIRVNDASTFSGARAVHHRNEP
jgi:hypothetical protein